jgi:hypothetical protein
MNITQFCQRHGFVHHGTPTNSWDSFHPSGAILMQLWQAPGQRIRTHVLPEAYLRVRCFDRAHFEVRQSEQRTGYNGRIKSICAVENGATGFALMSAPPSDRHGAGAWSRHANLERVFPILAIEREDDGDVFAVLASPLLATELGRIVASGGLSASR